MQKTFCQFARIGLCYGCILPGTLLTCLAIHAQSAYQVHIDAPKEIKVLLEKHLNLIRYQNSTELNQDQFNFLIASTKNQITQIIATEGYFSPTVTIQLDNTHSQSIVHIHVNVQQRTFISDVHIELTGEATQEIPSCVKRLRHYWRLPAGKPFRQEDWEDAKNRTLQYLQRHRYPAAKIDFSEARIDSTNHTAQLEINYNSGPTFTLGTLQTSGLKRYPKKIIEHMNPIKIGELYESDRLLELQRQIQSTPYFRSVQVTINDDPTYAKLTPVHVRVTEYPTQQIRLGGGYASDTGAHINGSYSHLNVFKRAWVFNTQTDLEQHHQYGLLKLAMPPDTKGFTNSIHTSTDRTTLEGIDLRSLRTGIEHERTQENDSEAFSLDYYRDNLQQLNGTTLPNQIITPTGNHQAFVPGYSWSRRDVNNPLFPRRGNIISVQTNFAIKGIMTDESFARFYTRVKHYIPLARRDLMVIHGEAGAVFSKGDSNQVPASLLFRAGGTNSIRGYNYQSIGNLQNGTVYPTKYLATGGIEYQHWFLPQWGSALFYDLGTATNDWNSRNLYHGIGIGARWRSPVGPVNIDLAYGIQDRQIRPHISLGVAF